MVEMQRELGKRQIQAYELPTEVARYDTTTVSVHHEEGGKELFRFGHSKDRRPDLLQFKQGLGTLDPAGVPLCTHTLSGETADDGLYVPAWEEMSETIGHRDFLFVTDSKGGSEETRETVDHKGGTYLCPLALTGKRPEWLAEHVNKEVHTEIMLLSMVDKAGNPRQYGVGFKVERERERTLLDGTREKWKEVWFGLRSDSHRKKRENTIRTRLEKCEERLTRLRPKAGETGDAFKRRAEKIIAVHHAKPFFTVTVNETVTRRKKYLKPGRPRANTPYEWVNDIKLTPQFDRNQPAIDHAFQMAGWRIFVTNRLTMTMEQAVCYYKDNWQVERGFHRFKNGSLPALPLYLRLPDRIRGLMLLLFIALQALTLLEFVASRSLSEKGESIAGLYPGNPRRKTERPSAEQMLASFEYLHLLIQQVDEEIQYSLNESLSSVQTTVLSILQLSLSIYRFESTSVNY